jgi:hypothetical protein
MRLTRALPGLAIALALLLPGAARADLLAAVQVTGPDGSADIAVMNAATGARLALPAGINTAAQELHPSIATDGKRLVFLRQDPAAGTTRVIVLDTTTGQTADLFSGFEVAQRPPSDPEIARDGSVVYTGAPFAPASNGNFRAEIVFTQLANFPNGPFSRGTIQPQYNYAHQGATSHPSAGGIFIAYGEQRPGFTSSVILSPLGGNSSSPLSRTDHAYSHPAIAASSPQLALLVDRPAAGGPGDIVFRPATVAGLPGTPTVLPAIVNSGDESLPAFTPDSRYVGFVRRYKERDRLFVWDSQTQTLLNGGGIDLGGLAFGETGNLSLYFRAVFVRTAVAQSGLVSANLTAPSGVGLLVQRITGRQRILGKRAFKLRAVGRVPLGSFKKGKLRKRWDLRVNGKRLRPGRYLVTVRAVTRKRVVRELGRPKVIRIRRR